MSAIIRIPAFTDNCASEGSMDPRGSQVDAAAIDAYHRRSLKAMTFNRVATTTSFAASLRARGLGRRVRDHDPAIGTTEARRAGSAT
jgi:hypothetical protein